jgi:pyruvate formate lyase activating enzyme
MSKCRICRNASPSISKELGVCLACIRQRPDQALPCAMDAHKRSRDAFGLPAAAPRDPKGVRCKICVNECSIPEGGTGYCGLRKNDKGRMPDISTGRGKLSWYHDPLPTNCVGDWVCPGGTGAGYPRYAYRNGPEVGYKNLAVFFHACSFNCLFCQNWTFRQETQSLETHTVEELVADVDEKTACICYFGGDPAPQLPFSIRASRLARARRGNSILRICWETGGAMHPALLKDAATLALDSGGCIKFDLKTWDENLHIALTGITNRRTLENFQRAGSQLSRRRMPPPVLASTLLVPGYIDENEVRHIARFIASVNPDIPYSLLGFYPHFFMSDLPRTSRALAERCRAIAHEEGLQQVKIGNLHLLN